MKDGWVGEELMFGRYLLLYLFGSGLSMVSRDRLIDLMIMLYESTVFSLIVSGCNDCFLS